MHTQVILLAIAKCDRLAAVPQLLLSFEVLLHTNSTSRSSVVNKVGARCVVVVRASADEIVYLHAGPLLLRQVVLVVRVETPDQSLRWCKENQDLVDRIQRVGCLLLKKYESRLD